MCVCVMCECMCSYMWMCAYMCVYVYVCLCLFSRVYACGCLCVYVHVCVLCLCVWIATQHHPKMRSKLCFIHITFLILATVLYVQTLILRCRYWRTSRGKDLPSSIQWGKENGGVNGESPDQPSIGISEYLYLSCNFSISFKFCQNK